MLSSRGPGPDCRPKPNSAYWLRKQWHEELDHALRLLDHVVERASRPTLLALDAPQAEFQSLTQVLETVLAHEQQVTASIYRLYEQALQERDWASQSLLQWYVSEQVEEEQTAQESLDLLRIAGDKGATLVMVDRRLGERA
jgi:ferritin